MSRNAPKRRADPGARTERRPILVAAAALVVVALVVAGLWAVLGRGSDAYVAPERPHVKNAEPADRALVSFSCDPAAGTASGVLVNTVSRTSEYVVTAVVRGADKKVVAEKSRTFRLKAGKHADVTFTGIDSGEAKPVSCSPEVVRSGAAAK